jgi:hypothetical protein
MQQMRCVADQRSVEQFMAAGLIHRCMIEFIRGIRTPLSTTVITARIASNKAG